MTAIALAEKREEIRRYMDPVLFDVSQSCLKTQAENIPGHGSPLCLVGPPGLGKTHHAAQVAEYNNLMLMTVILGRIPSIDIGGMVIPDLENDQLKHMITRRFLGENVPKEYDGVLINFDEVGTAMDDQQASIQSMVEDWTMEGHALGKNVFFQFGTNGAEDNCGAKDLIKSLQERVFIHRYAVSKPTWMKWAVHNVCDPSITAFINWKEEYLHQFDPKAPMSGSPNPRSWMKLSYLLEAHGPDLTPQMRMVYAKGKVGEAAAFEYCGHAKIQGELALIEEVMSHPETAAIPHHNNSAMFAMISIIAYEFGTMHKKGIDLAKEHVDAAITYIERMDESMAVYGFTMLTDSNPLFSKRSERFAEFKMAHKDLSV